MDEHKAMEYYQRVVGESFAGQFVGVYDRGDGARSWLKITINQMSKEMRDSLGEIEDRFEGHIWKGFHNGVLYVQAYSQEHEDDLTNGAEFKIIAVRFFEFGNAGWKEPYKYTDQCGFHFDLRPL